LGSRSLALFRAVRRRRGRREETALEMDEGIVEAQVAITPVPKTLNMLELSNPRLYSEMDGQQTLTADLRERHKSLSLTHPLKKGAPRGKRAEQ
jgi:hypothetical protein